MIRSDPCVRTTRRGFITAGAVLLSGSGAPAAPPKGDPAEAALSADERKQVDAVRDRGRSAGLGLFRLHSGDHYLVVGDAPDAFQEEVLGFCEKLGKEFLPYYNRKGFPLDYPESRLMVVVLSSRESYGVWLGEPAGDAVGGHYNREENRLVVFDFRNDPGRLGAQARVVNSFTLAHETNHLLGFNTGLLSRSADAPLCVVEGLATIGELFQKVGRSTIGGFNKPRMTALAEAARGGAAWIELPDLIAGDALLEDPDTFQAAYAESWLLISTLLKSPEGAGRLRAYLARLKAPRAAAAPDRLREAEADLGPLDALNREMLRAAGPYLRR